MRHKKILFPLALIAGTYLALEIFSFGLYYVMEGKAFSFADLSSHRAMVMASLDNGKQGNAVVGIMSNHTIPHPYVGFVYDPEKSNDPTLSPYGFRAERDPIAASSDPDTVIVAITGGSVSEYFYIATHDKLRKMIEKMPRFHGKKIDIVMLGRGMYHQPQQVFSVAYYLMQGGRLDILINLDGFNEITGGSESHAQGVYPAYPYAWQEIFSALSDADTMPKLGEMSLWKHIQHMAVHTFEPLRFSVTASTFWSLLDHYCVKKESLVEGTMFNTGGRKLPYFIAGPSTLKDANPKQILDFEMGFWEKGSMQIQALSKLYHFDYFHFLQPNQYVINSKPFSEDELKIAYNPKDPRYVHLGTAYPLLEAGIVRLKSKGENAYSLTGIFKHENKTVYGDVCCHVNELGNDIMVDAIGKQIARFYEGH